MPLDEYARQRSLGPEDVAHLLIDVLDGISHAHSRRVVHRDLKPGNILVDDGGRPHIVDFGIARALSVDGSTARTRLGEVVGTVAYMSPEQVRADPAAIGPQVDLYAVGAIGYELLAGRRPVPTEAVPLAEALRRVEQLEPANLPHGVPRDLATALFKALAKEPERRYASADAFAQDLRRYLAREPILARPPSATYRVTRFVARHRGLTVGVGAALLALLTGTALSNALYLQEQRVRRDLEAKDVRLRSSLAETSRALAQAEEAIAEAEYQLFVAGEANRFYTGLISQAGDTFMGKHVPLRAVLDQGTRTLESAFRAAPVHRARILASLAAAYEAIGLHSEARERIASSHRTLASASVGDPFTERLLARMEVGLDMDAGDLPGALEAASRLIEIARGHSDILASEALASAHAERAQVRRNMGDLEGALSDLERAETTLGQGDPQRPSMMHRRAKILGDLGRDDEAFALQQLTDSAFDALGRGMSPEAALAKDELGLAYLRRGKLEQAKAHFEGAASLLRKIIGPGEHLDGVLQHLASAQSALDQRGH